MGLATTGSYPDGVRTPTLNAGGEIPLLFSGTVTHVALRLRFTTADRHRSRQSRELVFSVPNGFLSKAKALLNEQAGLSQINSWQRPTLPHSRPCSTIGPAGLIFSVRNGKRSDTRGIVTRKIGFWRQGKTR